jgi:hypothetical protein
LATRTPRCIRLLIAMVQVPAVWGSRPASLQKKRGADSVCDIPARSVTARRVAPPNDFGFLLQEHHADPLREPPGECSGARSLPFRTNAWSGGYRAIQMAACQI